METRKSAGMFLASAAAAAVTLAKIRLDEFAVGVLNAAIGNLVLHRVDQFDVADRIRRLLHESGNTFVALAAKANRPIHGGAALPTLLFHSPLTLARKSVQM